MIPFSIHATLEPSGEIATCSTLLIFGMLSKTCSARPGAGFGWGEGDWARAVAAAASSVDRMHPAI
jgi:hypothetical protein